MENLTSWQALFDLLLWIIIVLVLRPAHKYPYTLSKSRRMWGIILVLIFCLFPFWGGDYFHYRESFFTIKQGGYSGFEEFYQWIILNIANNYFTFRLIVWGLALFLLFGAYKRVGNSFDLSLFLFAAFYLPWFSYARASLAMACIIYGLTFITKPTQRASLISIIFGVVFICLSVFFHRSAVLGIVAVIAALCIVKTSKTRIVLLIILFPLVVYLITQVLDTFMGVDTGDLDIVFSQRKREGYLMEDDNGQLGIAAKVDAFLNRTPIIFMLVFYIVLFFKGDYNTFNRVEKIISSYVFAVVLLSIGFVFVDGYNTQALFYRTLFFAYPANAIFLASIRSRILVSKLYATVFYISLLSSFYALLYSFYCTIVR